MSLQPVAENVSEPAQQPHWVSRIAFQALVIILALTQVAVFYCVYRNWYWAAVPLVLFASHLMHGLLIGFHEASHGLLRKNRRFNEFDGVLIGILSFTSFTLYRAAHQTHHMHLGTERDEELWPFVDTKVPRWGRVTFALLELFAGLIFTPSVFMRTFFRKNSPIRAKRVRRRIWAEFILTAAIWTGAISAVAWFGLWKYFFFLYLVPAYIAANLQSWRKYIEHVGLTGATIRSATRSIVCETWLGRLVSWTLLHEPYHGVHHQRAGLTHAELPQYAWDLQPERSDETAPFPSYRHALIHLLQSLSDPQVGAHWISQVDAEQPRTATIAN
jgi:fatty acid desaturase